MPPGHRHKPRHIQLWRCSRTINSPSIHVGFVPFPVVTAAHHDMGLWLRWRVDSLSIGTDPSFLWLLESILELLPPSGGGTSGIHVDSRVFCQLHGTNVWVYPRSSNFTESITLYCRLRYARNSNPPHGQNLTIGRSSSRRPYTQGSLL